MSWKELQIGYNLENDGTQLTERKDRILVLENSPVMKPVNTVLWVIKCPHPLFFLLEFPQIVKVNEHFRKHTGAVHCWLDLRETNVRGKMYCETAQLFRSHSFMSVFKHCSKLH